ncbi:MAG: hypothetical protein A2Z93_14395 [Curvibacter sp. GWA2_64_110]|nr:MAG: hypothetical protein A2Z93_14395 [Curvibacter sp. GWA2_64_110]
MSAPTIILSAPQGWGKTRQKAALQVEFKCRHVIDDWHPSLGTCPGALHLTSMHPGDLEDFGIAPEDIHRRGWPCARDMHRPQRAQAGNIYTPLLSLLLSIFAAVLLGLLLASSFHLDTFTISDHSTEVAVAQDLEDAQRGEQQRQRLNVMARAICGNAEWEELGSGAIQCNPRHGLKPYAVRLAGAQP